MRNSGNSLLLLLAAGVFVISMLALRQNDGTPAPSTPGEAPPGRARPARATPDSVRSAAESGPVGRDQVRPRTRTHETSRVAEGQMQSFIISCPAGSDLGDIAALARTLGIGVSGRQDSLRALKVRGTARQLRELREVAEIPLKTEENVLVYVPYIGQETVRELVSGRPFGSGALAAIGVSQVGPDWGEGVTIAILDSGILDHPALTDAHIRAWDLVNEEDPESGPFAGHGTAVASLLAANGVTVQGLSPGSDILSIKVVDSFGVGEVFSLASGIVLAVDSGASIINISLGSSRPSAILSDAVAYAQEHGVVMVAAAGNEGGEILYPGAIPGVTAVGAINADGAKEAYSNSGDALDIMAPGTGVVSAWSQGENVSMTGTSASAPFVSGALAVLLARQPEMTASEALQALLDSSNDRGAPGADPEYGQGLLDVQRALNRDEPGHVDAALAEHYLSRTEPVDGQIRVLVTAQNRGTEVIDSLRVVTEFAGQRLEGRFVTVVPGQTVSMPVRIPEDLVSPDEGLSLRSHVMLSAGDSNPDNDRRSSRIGLRTVRQGP